MKHAKLLSEVLLALGKVEVIEQLIHDPEDPKQVYYGLQEERQIWINPQSTKLMSRAVGTLVHEAIHFVRPKWSENRTYKTEAEIAAVLSLEDRKAIYKLYRLVVKKRRGKVNP